MVISSFETDNKILSVLSLVFTGFALVLYVVRVCAVTFMLFTLEVGVVRFLNVMAFCMMVVGIGFLCVSMWMKSGSSKLNSVAEMLVAFSLVAILISLFFS